MSEQKRVLIVEDHGSLRESLAEILQAEGYETFAVGIAQEARAQAGQDHFNAALIDIKLPDGDGIQLLKSLKETHPEMVTIVITGYATLENAVAALHQGAYAYVVKPFDVRQLLATLARGLEKQELTQRNQRLVKDLEAMNQSLKEEAEHLRSARAAEMRAKVEMADQVSLLMAKTQELEEAYLDMARTLALMVEARDPYTRGHSERLSWFAQEIAAEMNASAQLMQEVQIAGKLHDIGKVAIPDSILLKQGPLTPGELAEIQQHPTRGVEIIRFLSFLKDIFPLIEGHHERYDGSGYPHRLKGEDIPLGARILAVADAYDAITSERVYRHRRSHQEAMTILREGAGGQWDPDVVNSFERVLSRRASMPA